MFFYITRNLLIHQVTMERRNKYSNFTSHFDMTYLFLFELPRCVNLSFGLIITKHGSFSTNILILLRLFISVNKLKTNAFISLRGTFIIQSQPDMHTEERMQAVHHYK